MQPSVRASACRKDTPFGCRGAADRDWGDSDGWGQWGHTGESGSVSHDLPSTLAGSDDTHSTTVVLRALLEPDFSAILRRSNGWHP
jgi:hypothetical protein